ncbi:restriction endonuclease subunit S [Parabacteroides distasonis]|nr:restriction endonuclease subunit S [Parabacteroides distasonis]
MTDVPHLRFPEFSGEWENTELQYIAPNICSGKDKPTSNGTVALYGSTGIIGMTRLASYNEEIVLVARVGANAGQLQITTIPCGVTDNTLIINAKEWNRYIYYYLQHYNLNRLVFGSGQPLITGSMLKKLKIIYGEESERNKIVNLLCLLDERIATQNKIIDKLQSLIKGIAQNITCSNKPNVHISECLECSSSTLQESDVCENGAYPVYGANGVVGYLNYYNTLSEAIYIIKDGSGVGTVSYVTGKCSPTGTLNILQVKDGYSLRYLYYLLKVFNFEPYKTGMAIPHIYFKDYGKAKIFCPQYSEQLKYATLLFTIDDKLSTEQEILKSLNLEKQYLLRQMFI